MNEEKKVKKKVKKEDKTEARLAYLERKAVQFERVKNWLETIHGADIDGDSHIGAPKEGSVMTKLLVCISAFCILCGSLFAGVIDDKSAGTGTYTLSQSSIGTGDITLTVDAVVADVTGGVTGDVTTDDINASGANTATLDVNLGANTNVTMSTVTYKQSTPALNVEDGDKRIQVELSANNNSSQTVSYVTEEYIVSDATDTTEDGSKVIKIMKDGADTTVSTLDASGLTIVGNVAGTTLSGNEATIDGKYGVVGGDASTGLMVQAASITSTSSTLQTNAFAVAFGAAPVVTVSYTEDPGSAEAPWIVSVASNQVVVTTVADKNYSYIAVGARP
jgi:hypothetical protein